MTTVLSQQGKIALPESVREQLRLNPGDELEITIEDDRTITLRRVLQPSNHGLADLLLSCPGSFQHPARDKDDSKPLSF